MAKVKKLQRIMEGFVCSDKMDKTIVVRVERRLLDSIYKKIVVKHKKFKAHDEKNTAKVGDKVRIIETRAFSKDKHFRLLEVVK